jgi:hypothetical protein
MTVNKGFNDYKIMEDYTIVYIRDIKTSMIEEVYIDTEDLQKLIELNAYWNKHLEVSKSIYYIVATKYLGTDENGKHKSQHYKLHRFLLDENDSKIAIDHKNNNTFDNRKSNLRKTINKDNLKNRKGKNTNNKSGVRNVCTIDGYYRIQLQINGKNKRFPEKFTDIISAAEFAEKMRNLYYGEFAGKG